MKKLMLGNEAIARGLYEAGCTLVSSYPGTPSTEITEYAALYEEIFAEWAPNEKVSAEVAFGAALAGSRAFCGMKHVGLNVAADLLFTASYTGINGGLVIAVADDPGMHSSQNEQDSRYYAIASKVPMLEPADSAECIEYTKRAFELSEEFDTPVIVRLSTRISHSQSVVNLSERQEFSQKPYEKNPSKYVMMPGAARQRHIFVEARTKKLIEMAEVSDINSVEMGGDIGIITSGVSYQYAKEALGDKASYLKLGMVNPLPEDLIRDFAAKFKKVYVIEELDPIIENHCKTLGISVTGKEIFSLLGEYTSTEIAKQILGKHTEFRVIEEHVPVRPPVLCAGCPHRGIFYVMSKMKLFVSGDIGCYTLAAQAPINAMDTTICMGASVSALHGFNKARGEKSEGKSVGVIGDSTFIHSGITGLIDIAYNGSNSVVVILDNSITGMTGHQHNPTTGYTLKGDAANAVDLEALCNAIGINRVVVVDPFDIAGCERVLKEELAAKEPSVIIARRPCALLKSVKILPTLYIDNEKCRQCGQCQKMGCPAIKNSDGVLTIVETICTGCGVCKKVCKFDAISGEGKSHGCE
ncbi:MAG: indolepyruvate ferredoxin oxidoreductase subunit alpha [Bacillota bacterium]